MGERRSMHKQGSGDRESEGGGGRGERRSMHTQGESRDKESVQTFEQDAATRNNLILPDFRHSIAHRHDSGRREVLLS